jgi:ElaB/YqjD/DUF883 family membrane-anchored ribosome-binding protein
MTSSTHEQRSWRYERDAEATRHRLAENLNEISDRLTPGQVFDEMLTYARGGGGTFWRALTNASRENPVPSLLIGAGCMLFLSEKMGLHRYLDRASNGNGAGAGSDLGNADGPAQGAVGRASRTAASGASSATESIRSGVRSATDFAAEQVSGTTEGMKKGASAVGEKLTSASGTITEAARDLGDRASEAADQVKRGARGAGEAVQNFSQSMGDQLTDAASETRRQTARGARQAKESVMAFVQEQPLLSAAIGLAIGAAVAALLPATEKENELMGEASDAVKKATGDVAASQLETAKTAGARVAHEAMRAAEREGLTPAAAADAARQFGEKVKTVASQAGAAGKAEAEDLASAAAKPRATQLDR